MRKPEPWLGVTEAKDGWVIVDGPELVFAVRFARRSDGRLVAVESHQGHQEALQLAHLRELPIRSLEAWVNDPGHEEEFLDDAPMLDERPSPSEFVEGLEIKDPKAEEDLVRASRRRPTLELGDTGAGGRKPDSFYLRVARAYVWLARRTRRPAAELAEINDVPVTTVHRWVKEARRRGHLPTGHKGRAG